MIITNLFSSFDPSTNYLSSFNWVAGRLFIILLINKFWVKPRVTKTLFNLITKRLFNEFKIIVGNNKYFRVILMSLFSFIVINNFLGLFPYIFTSTRHMAVSLSIAVPIWVGIIFYGWAIFNKDIFAHLVPQSTPGVLMPFMVLIERIRNVIRPLTLSIRLSANIIAGHLLITLLGNQIASRALTLLPIIIVVQLALVTLELAVSIIQAYVFSILITLYVREIGSH